MMYSEFIDRIGHDKEHLNGVNDTYTQFLNIEKIYMSCETMTKDDVVKIWKMTYGKALELSRKRAQQLVTDMAEYRGEGSLSVKNAMLIAGIAITDSEEFKAGSRKAGYTNADGINFILQEINKVNGNTMYQMYITYNGQTHETHLRYFTGNFYFTKD